MESELPFQTYERVTESLWPGGTNNRIIALLKIFGIDARPGSAEANLALQAKLFQVTVDFSGLKKGTTP
jgi:hypothetical protein